MVIYYLQQQMNDVVGFATTVVALGFMTAIGKSFTSAVAGSSSPKAAEKVVATCPICGQIIEVPEYDRITRSEALKRHIEAKHSLEQLPYASHHSMWLTPEQRKALEKKYGAVATRWGEEMAPVGDIEFAETAAKGFYEKLREVLTA